MIAIVTLNITIGDVEGPYEYLSTLYHIEDIMDS